MRRWRAAGTSRTGRRGGAGWRGLALRVRSDRTDPALELLQGSSVGRTGGEVWWTMSGADGRRLRPHAGFRPDGASWRAELGMELAGCAQTCRWGPTTSLRSASARGSEPVDGGRVRRRRRPAPAHRHCIGQGLSICLAARAAGELPRAGAKAGSDSSEEVLGRRCACLPTPTRPQGRFTPTVNHRTCGLRSLPALCDLVVQPGTAFLGRHVQTSLSGVKARKLPAPVPPRILRWIPE